MHTREMILVTGAVGWLGLRISVQLLNVRPQVLGMDRIPYVDTGWVGLPLLRPSGCCGECRNFLPPAMKILATGDSGFIGRHLISTLITRGKRVLVISRYQPTPAANIEWKLAPELDDRSDWTPAQCFHDLISKKNSHSFLNVSSLTSTLGGFEQAFRMLRKVPQFFSRPR
jgi:nucleoside-diphosphate-sugar epimerase